MLINRPLKQAACPALLEVARRYRLGAQLDPFRRCLRCNGLLNAVEKADIINLLQPLIRLYFNEFQRCANCGQVYWAGSHHIRLTARMENVRNDHS